MIDISQMQTRSAMDDYALRFINEQDNFIADKVFPWKYVNKSSTKKYQYDSSMLKQVVTKNTSKASANAVDYGVFATNIDTKLNKLKAEIDPRDEANFDRPVADIKLDQIANIQSRLLISREIQAATLATTAANYPAALTQTLAAGSTFIDAAGNPEDTAIAIANALHVASGRTPNAVAMSGTTLRLLRMSPVMRDRIKYTSSGTLPDSALKEYLGVKYLFVGDAVYDSAVEGATPVIGDIWDDSMLFFVYEPNPAPKSMSFGHTWVRKDIYTHEWADNERGGPDGRIQWIEQGLEYDMTAGFVTSAASPTFSAGYLLKNAV